RPPESPPFPYTTLFRSCRQSTRSVRQRRCRCHHDAVATVPNAETCRSCPPDAWPCCDRSVRDIRPCRRGRCRTGTCRAGCGLARSEEHTSELQSLAYLV